MGSNLVQTGIQSARQTVWSRGLHTTMQFAMVVNFQLRTQQQRTIGNLSPVDNNAHTDYLRWSRDWAVLMGTISANLRRCVEHF